MKQRVMCSDSSPGAWSSFHPLIASSPKPTAAFANASLCSESTYISDKPLLPSDRQHSWITLFQYVQYLQLPIHRARRLGSIPRELGITTKWRVERALQLGSLRRTSSTDFGLLLCEPAQSRQYREETPSPCGVSPDGYPERRYGQ